MGKFAKAGKAGKAGKANHLNGSKRMTAENKQSLHPKALVTVLGFSMLVVGICGISYEYTFSRLASDIMGNSVKQWAIIIGLMMFFMGVGADLQKYFPDRYNVDNFILLEVILGLLGGIGPSVTLYAFGSMNQHFILIHYFFICSIGLLIGLEIPLLTRVNQMTVPSLKHNLGLILKMDYIGSFVGALVWVFVLPRFFDMLQISFFLGILNISVALIAWFWFHPWMVHPRLIPVAGVFVSMILIVGLANGRKITSFAEQKLYRDPIVFTKTTPYQRIVITRNRSGDFYLYINGHLQFSSNDEYIYHEFLVHPVLSALEHRKKVLVLGGGDGLAVREILKYGDVESITLVDIDPEMTTLAATNPELVALNQGSLINTKVGVEPSRGVTRAEKVTLTQFGQSFFRRQRKNEEIEIFLYNIDAYAFVQSISGIYDAIIIDFPDPNNLDLAKLYSLEFYSMLRDKLAFDGLIIQQSSTPSLAKEVFLIVGRTMQAAGLECLPLHHYVPSFGDWGWWVAGHRERYSKRLLAETLSRPHELPENLRYITREVIASSLQFGKNALVSSNRDINTLLDTRIYFHYEKALAWYQ
jgi:spermidine synthase